MTIAEIQKRKRVMQRSMKLGHCICDARKPCPCDVFKDEGYCHCAGETPKVADGPVKLTQHVRNAGCASKISKGVLKEVLAGLPEIDDPRVIVGASAGDDAGVMMLGKDGATILTVDVFCPSVDDPYTFGQIAAANSLSDIYAMGGEPQVALSIVGFPVHLLPTSAMREMLRGGLDKMREAGVPVIGGHSINDEEIKCGFAVVGRSPAAAFVRNAGAQVGDVIILTKPLGGGIVAFAHQIGRATGAAMDEVARSMAHLNRAAGRLMVAHSAHAATDVTGFSLMGHLVEIVENSSAEVTLDFDAIPLFTGVRELAGDEVIPGGVERNRESVDPRLFDLETLVEAQRAVLYCPETSGGMLVFMSPVDAEGFVRDMHAAGESATVIGKVTGSRAGGFIRATTGSPWQAAGAAVEPRMFHVEHLPNDSEGAQGSPAACCCDGPEAATSAEGLPAADNDQAYKAYMSAVSSAGAIDLKNKKLIGLALSVMGKCEPCVKINAKAARDAGASEKEIAEAVAMGIAFGGSTVAMFYSTLRQRK